MRRSAAPTMRRALQRKCTTDAAENVEPVSSTTLDAETPWGTRSSRQNQRSANFEKKLLYSVEWREQSGKKHKTWIDVGTLEVQLTQTGAANALLRDADGKYVSGGTIFKQQELQEDALVVVGSMEVHLLEQLQDKEELNAVRREQRKCREQETKDTGEPEEKKPKGSFVFRPYLNLTMPKMAKRVVNTKVQEKSTAAASVHNTEQMLLMPAPTALAFCSKFMPRRQLPRKQEYIVFVRPAELQELLLREALQFYMLHKQRVLETLTPLQLITILKKICNYPSLVERTKSPNLFTRNLERFLPDCMEMGPFDSTKLELVQQLLIATAQQRQEKCVIVCNHMATRNILQGLCDHMQLQCLRLNDTMPVNEQQQLVQQFNDMASDALVFLLSAKTAGTGLNLTGASRLILFDNDWNPATDAQAMSCIWRDDQQHNVQIYRLITAGCIEDKMFQRQIFKTGLRAHPTALLDAEEFSADELLHLIALPENFDTCETHKRLQCQCAGDGNNLHQLPIVEPDEIINQLHYWQHYQPPFDKQFLKTAELEAAAEAIVYIFAQERELQI